MEKNKIFQEKVDFTYSLAENDCNLLARIYNLSEEAKKQENPTSWFLQKIYKLTPYVLVLEHTKTKKRVTFIHHNWLVINEFLLRMIRADKFTTVSFTWER